MARYIWPIGVTSRPPYIERKTRARWTLGAIHNCRRVESRGTSSKGCSLSLFGGPIACEAATGSVSIASVLGGRCEQVSIWKWPASVCRLRPCFLPANVHPSRVCPSQKSPLAWAETVRAASIGSRPGTRQLATADECAHSLRSAPPANAATEWRPCRSQVPRSIVPTSKQCLANTAASSLEKSARPSNTLKEACHAWSLKCPCLPVIRPKAIQKDHDPDAFVQL